MINECYLKLCIEQCLAYSMYSNSLNWWIKPTQNCWKHLHVTTETPCLVTLKSSFSVCSAPFLTHRFFVVCFSINILPKLLSFRPPQTQKVPWEITGFSFYHCPLGTQNILRQKWLVFLNNPFILLYTENFVFIFTLKPLNLSQHFLVQSLNKWQCMLLVSYLFVFCHLYPSNRHGNFPKK